MDELSKKEEKETSEKRQVEIHYEDDAGEGLYQSIKFSSFEELGQIEDYIEKKREEKEKAIDLTGLGLSQENGLHLNKIEKRLDSFEKALKVLSDRIDTLERLINRISDLQD